MYKTLQYTVKEVVGKTDPVEFTVAQALLYDENWKELIVKEAAYVFYYGQAGFQEAWPLLFSIWSKKTLLTTADVYILGIGLTDKPNHPYFEVI